MKVVEPSVETLFKQSAEVWAWNKALSAMQYKLNPAQTLELGLGLKAARQTEAESWQRRQLKLRPQTGDVRGMKVRDVRTGVDGLEVDMETGWSGRYRRLEQLQQRGCNRRASQNLQGQEVRGWTLVMFHFPLWPFNRWFSPAWF